MDACPSRSSCCSACCTQQLAVSVFVSVRHLTTFGSCNLQTTFRKRSIHQGVIHIVHAQACTSIGGRLCPGSSYIHPYIARNRTSALPPSPRCRKHLGVNPNYQNGHPCCLYSSSSAERALPSELARCPMLFSTTSALTTCWYERSLCYGWQLRLRRKVAGSE